MGNIEGAGGRNITIGAIHGFGQRPEHWDLMRPLLAAQGIGMIAVDLPVGNPHATCEDYAATAAEAFSPAVENGDYFFMLDHSMGARPVPWTVRRLRRLRADAVSGIIDVSPSIDGASGDVVDLAARLMPQVQIPQQRKPEPSNSDEFRKAIWPLADGLYILDPTKYRHLLFNACDNETFQWLVEHAPPRPAGRPKDVPSEQDHRVLSTVFGIKRLYVKTDQDNVRRGEERTADAIGADLVTISGDHSPAVSNPEGLVAVVVDFISRVIAEKSIEAPQLPPLSEPFPWQSTAHGQVALPPETS